MNKSEIFFSFPRRKYIFLLIFPFFVCGCIFFPHKKPSPLQEVKESGSDFSAKVTRGWLLKKEGMSLMIVPFTAGVGVVADKDLDRLSLMIVKGIMDTLQKQNTPFKILPASQAQDADFVVRGHITGRARARARVNWISYSQKYSLSVDARMTERATDNLILMYSRQRETPSAKEKQDDEMNLAWQLGQDIAEYILAIRH